MASSFKKDWSKFRILTDWSKKGIRWGICHAIHQYAKANNKYMRDYGKNKESSYLKHWDLNNLYGRALLEKLPVNNFE